MERPIDKARAALAENPELTVSQLTGIIGVSWPTAKKLRDQILGNPVKEQTAREESADDDSDDSGGMWDLPIQVPAERADDIWGVFTLDEKMNAIRSVIQARMDAMLTTEVLP